jgi:hypothetical protein
MGCCGGGIRYNAATPPLTSERGIRGSSVGVIKSAARLLAESKQAEALKTESPLAPIIPVDGTPGPSTETLENSTDEK